MWVVHHSSQLSWSLFVIAQAIDLLQNSDWSLSLWQMINHLCARLRWCEWWLINPLCWQDIVNTPAIFLIGCLLISIYWYRYWQCMIVFQSNSGCLSPSPFSWLADFPLFICIYPQITLKCLMAPSDLLCLSCHMMRSHQNRAEVNWLIVFWFNFIEIWVSIYLFFSDADSLWLTVYICRLLPVSLSTFRSGGEIEMASKVIISSQTSGWFRGDRKKSQKKEKKITLPTAWNFYITASRSDVCEQKHIYTFTARDNWILMCVRKKGILRGPGLDGHYQLSIIIML